MDVVVTSGRSSNAAAGDRGGWLAPGTFASPVDFDSYWQGAALREVDRLATDDVAQMEHYRGVGYFAETPRPYADLGEIVAGRKPGRESDAERTMCINLGIALDDMATAVLLYRLAREKGVGVELPL